MSDRSAPKIWMPLYIGDYLKDTRRLSTLEHGAYLLLIMEYWQQGGLPDDDAQLARIAGLSLSEWRSVRPTLSSFFTNGWNHERIERELAQAKDKQDKAREAALRRWKNRPPNPPTPSERNADAYADGHADAYADGHADGYARNMLVTVTGSPSQEEVIFRGSVVPIRSTGGRR